MKIQKRIILAVLSFLMATLLAIPSFAALPQIDEIQWQNTKMVTCDVLISGNQGTATASIIGKTGSSVQGSVELYETISGVTTLIYSNSKPASSAPPRVSFTYSFTVQSGATYYLELNGTVSKGGYDEPITASDTEVIP